MASRRTATPIDQLDKAIGKILSEYADECGLTLADAQRRVAARAVSALKQTSPRDEREPKGRKHYADNWKSTTEHGTASDRTTIYNDDPTYRVTHLLEKGHRKVNGGRGRVAAREHIRPVADMVEREFLDELKRRL